MIGAMVDFTYSLSNGKLTVREAQNDPGSPKEVTIPILIDINTLVEKPQAGEEVRMIRRSRTDDASSIVGTWNYRYVNGARAYATFTKDGKEYLRVPMNADKGTWSADGDNLKLAIGTNEPATFTFHIENGLLTMTESSGKPTSYRRSHE